MMFTFTRSAPWRGVVSDDRTGDRLKPRCPQCDTGLAIVRAEGVERRPDYDQWRCRLCGMQFARWLALR